MAEVGDILSPEVFYKESHKEIFKATETLFQNAEPIDVMTVKNQLQLNKKLKFHLNWKICSIKNITPQLPLMLFI